MLRRPLGATGIEVPVIGQGTWRMGEDRKAHRQELDALRLGLDLGLTHNDTAEMYGDGGAETAAREAPRRSAWLTDHPPGFTPMT